MVSIFMLSLLDGCAEGIPLSQRDSFGGAGLPSGGKSGAVNTAEYMVEGVVKPSKIITARPAKALDGNSGGLPEYLINHRNVKQKTYSTFKPFL